MVPLGASGVPAARGSFARRRLGVTIRIGRGKDGEDGADVHELPAGLRIRADITVAGGEVMGSATLRIYGLTLDLMNQVSTLGLSTKRTRSNTITISAGDEGGALSQVFEGTIQEANHDFGGSPETCLAIQAYAGMRDKLRPVPAVSYRGGVDVALVLRDIASRAGMTFANNGVSVILTDPNFPGTALDQINAACEHAHIEHDISNNQLTIWPMGGSRGGQVALISPETGMQGYPMVGGNNYLRISTLFNPSLARGSQVRIDSQIPQARGLWTIYLLSHALESETPGGNWFTSFECYPPNVERPIG